MTTEPTSGRHRGRTIVVTGGGSGIGRASALRLAQEGAAVAIGDIRSASAQRVADEIKEHGGLALALGCDVSKEKDVWELVSAAEREFGPPSAAFANAGTAGAGWIHETDLEDWKRVLDVNLTGVFLTAKHVLPHFLTNNGGVFVSTGSIASVVVGAGGSAASYAASKGGILQLTRQIAVDYGDYNVRAICVCPGAVATNLGKHAGEDRAQQRTPATRPLPRPTHWTPIKRAADADEIAAVVSFAISDDASFMTGCALFADGGLTAI